MKLESAAILIAALLSVAVSGCSSFRIALDYGTALEDYTVYSSKDDVELSGYSNNLQLLPTIVSSGSLQPLVTLTSTGTITTYGLGLDYNIIYLGYDTPTLISDIINNRRSLSDAIESPESADSLNTFMFIPSILWYRKNLDEKSLLELGYGKPYYSSINYKNEKYYLDDANQFSFTWGYEVGNNFRLLLPEWRDPDRKALILFKYFSTKFSASTKDSSKSISSTIFTGQGIVRIYF